MMSDVRILLCGWQSGCTLLSACHVWKLPVSVWQKMHSIIKILKYYIYVRCSHIFMNREWCCPLHEVPTFSHIFWSKTVFFDHPEDRGSNSTPRHVPEYFSLLCHVLVNHRWWCSTMFQACTGELCWRIQQQGTDCFTGWRHFWIQCKEYIWPSVSYHKNHVDTGQCE